MLPLAHAPLGTCCPWHMLPLVLMYVYHTTHTHIAVSLLIQTYVRKQIGARMDEEGFNCTYVIVKLCTYDYCLWWMSCKSKYIYYLYQNSPVGLQLLTKMTFSNTYARMYTISFLLISCHHYFQTSDIDITFKSITEIDRCRNSIDCCYIPHTFAKSTLRQAIQTTLVISLLRR